MPTCPGWSRAYLLAATATTPLFGKLSDIHGRRTILLLSISIFVVGSVACALAPAMWVLILGRALQGIGGGGLLPIVQTIIADLLSPRERPLVQSYVSVTFMSASILGPVLGGLLTDHLHWSFIFWLNLPLGAVALVMTARALRRLPRHERPHRLDIVGGALMVGAALALMLALTWGGVRYGWASWSIVSLLVGSAVLWILFVARLLTAREPFIPVVILRGRVTSAITCASFFAIGTVIGVTIYTPLYCQIVLGASASASGLVLIAFMVGTTVGSLAAGRLIVRLTHYMRVPIVGLVIAVAVLGLLAAVPARLSLGVFALLLAVLGSALGPMYTVATVVMQNAVKRHQLGTATGTLNFFRVLGGAIVVAAFGAIVIGGAGDAASVMMLGKLAGGHGDFASAFRFVFIAAAVWPRGRTGLRAGGRRAPIARPDASRRSGGGVILVNLPLLSPRKKAGQGIGNGPQLYTFSVKGQRLFSPETAALCPRRIFLPVPPGSLFRRCHRLSKPRVGALAWSSSAGPTHPCRLCGIARRRSADVHARFTPESLGRTHACRGTSVHCRAACACDRVRAGARGGGGRPPGPFSRVRAALGPTLPTPASIRRSDGLWPKTALSCTSPLPCTRSRTA